MEFWIDIKISCVQTRFRKAHHISLCFTIWNEHFLPRNVYTSLIRKRGLGGSPFCVGHIVTLQCLENTWQTSVISCWYPGISSEMRTYITICAWNKTYKLIPMHTYAHIYLLEIRTRFSLSLFHPLPLELSSLFSLRIPDLHHQGSVLILFPISSMSLDLKLSTKYAYAINTAQRCHQVKIV